MHLETPVPLLRLNSFQLWRKPTILYVSLTLEKSFADYAKIYLKNIQLGAPPSAQSVIRKLRSISAGSAK